MTLLSELQSLLGESHVLTGADAEPFALDWRRRYRGEALAVVRPGSTQQVADAIKLCARHGVPVVPQGGNTGLCGGATPDGSGSAVVLSTARLNRVRALDTDNDTITVEAGCILQAVQQAAADAGRLFPLSLAAEGSCTIGGNLATNAGGVAVLAYGNARELTTGVEVVLADGRIVNALSKLRKDNTGYDLKDLFVGAEGTLGIITAAALKLFAKPRARETAFVGLADPAAALALFRSAREHFGSGVVSFELIPRIALDFVLRHANGARDPLGAAHPWYVLVEIASQVAGGLADAVAEWLAGAAEAGQIDDAALAASGEQRAAFWALRENISDV
ncbi:FAD-binding oxidoreductase, partial [Achromobacter sp.]|uniref:FAD-binding oxidoreductase n=1 Tax=Achromobacter sp. TaxID=134375 RepID=UPI00258D0556